MGQSAYPSLVWQTYDYYYDLTGAYWGIKKACEPVHIQWSYADNSVKVINTTLQDLQGLKATARVYNLDGKEMGRYTQNVTLNAAANKDSYLSLIHICNQRPFLFYSRQSDSFFLRAGCP